MDSLIEKLLSPAQKVQCVFNDFYLSGGTAIMFRHRHRASIDLDFFQTGNFPSPVF